MNTIIEMFEAGNREMFHSAFLAWLMDENAPHDLGREFLERFLSVFNPRSNAKFTTPNHYKVLTEHTRGRNRYDIIVWDAEDDSSPSLVLENKVKSFGSPAQLDAYAAAGHRVGVVAFLPETIDAEGYPIITYAEVSDIISQMKLDRTSNPYHFIITEYLEHVRRSTQLFTTLRSWLSGDIPSSDIASAIGPLVPDKLGDNDVRTLTYFYYFHFEKYLRSRHPKLIFGTDDYEVAKVSGTNTAWQLQKNVQGPPFMESLLYDPAGKNAGAYRLHGALASIHEGQPLCLAPRLELWIDPRAISPELDAGIGVVMLGAWPCEGSNFSGFRDALASTEPYSTKVRPRGPRHFHHESVTVRDAPFASMADRIDQMMRLIGEFRS